MHHIVASPARIARKVIARAPSPVRTNGGSGLRSTASIHLEDADDSAVYQVCAYATFPRIPSPGLRLISEIPWRPFAISIRFPSPGQSKAAVAPGDFLRQIATMIAASFSFDQSATTYLSGR